MNSITGMLPSSVQVIRDSIEKEIPAQDLVLGDIVSRPASIYLLALELIHHAQPRSCSDWAKRSPPTSDLSWYLPISSLIDRS